LGNSQRESAREDQQKASPSRNLLGHQKNFRTKKKYKTQNTGRLGRPHQLQNHTPYGLHTCIQTLEGVRSGHVGGGKQYKSFPLGKKFYFYAENFYCFAPPKWPP